MRVLNAYCSDHCDGLRAQLPDPSLAAYDRLVAHVEVATAGTAADTGRRGCLLAKSAAELSATDADVVKTVKRTLDLGCGGLSRSRLMKAMKARLRRGSGVTVAPSADPNPPREAT